MAYDLKREKQIKQILPATVHLVKRMVTIENKDISDSLEKKKEFVPQDSDSDNYSLDNDSDEWERMEVSNESDESIDYDNY